MVDYEILKAMEPLRVTPEGLGYIRHLKIDDRLIEPHCGFVFVTTANLFSGRAGNVFRVSTEGGPVVVISALDHRERVRDLIAWPLYGSNRSKWATLKLEAELLGVFAKRCCTETQSHPLGCNSRLKIGS